MKIIQFIALFLVIFLSGCVTVEMYDGTPSKYENEISIKGEVIEEDGFDVAPEPIFQGKADYPDVWKKSPIDGYANAVFVVDERGKITQIQVEEATDRSFALSAIRCIKSWEFKPGMKDGKPVKVLVRNTLIFDVKQVANKTEEEEDFE